MFKSSHIGNPASRRSLNHAAASASVFTAAMASMTAMASMALSLAAAVAVSAVPARAADPAYTVGARVTVLGDKAGGLTMFPEAPITILKTTPQYEVLIPSGLRTAYCKGPSMDKLVATGFALQPSVGPSIDRVSAHITSAWTDPASGELYAVVNANDSDGITRIPGEGIGYRGRYYTAALAKSTNGGVSFTKLGAILSIPKNATSSAMQGDAFASVVMSPDKKWLYAYYGDMYNGALTAGIQTCVARASVESKGMPGSWKKWYAGQWVTEGNSVIDTAWYTGAETTPVVTNTVALLGDAMYPHVAYSAKLGLYVMVYAINIFDETPPADSLGKYPPVELSGIYIAYSQDAVSWGGHQQLFKGITIDYPGREVALHPTIVIDDAASSPTSLKATVYYGYSANMWWGTPATQYLVSRSLSVSGLSADLFPSPIAPPKTGHGVPAYSVLPGAAGELLLRFPDGAANGLRVVKADGSRAGNVRSRGAGQYQVSLSNAVGPVFLQGRRNGRSFSGYLSRN
jgi:hypothetical protein